MSDDATATAGSGQTVRTATPPGRSRIVEAHHQARRMLLVAAAFAVASPLTMLASPRTGVWLALHLFLVGSLVTAIAGTTQYLAVTWSNAPAPSRRLGAAQRWLLGLGTIAVAAGRELPSDPVTVVGAVAVVFALALVAVALIAVRRRGTTPRFRPAIDGYLVALGWSGVGIALGAALATGLVDDRYVETRSMHIGVNVFGFVGLVIAATLPYFLATQLRSKMSPRATPSRHRAVIAWLAVAVAVLVAGALSAHPAVAAMGYGAYGLGLIAEISLFPRVTRRHLDWGGPRLVQLAAGWLWWVGATGALAVHETTGHLEQRRVLQVLVVGGFAQILVASLAYLGPVLRGGGRHQLTAGFALTRSWPSLVAANVAAVALVSEQRTVAVVALLGWVADVASRTLRLVRGRGDGVRPRPAG